MRRAIFPLPALLLISSATAAMAQNAPMMPPPGPIVSLSVTESVDSAPDIATINTGVETRSMTAKDAMAQNAARIDTLIATLIKAGIARKDIQTSGINLNPQYDFSERKAGEGPRFLGYQANNSLNVIIRKLDKAGETIDAMVEAGATNINGPQFGIDNSETLLIQARAKAVQSAEARAQFYAKAAGYRTARLLEISENWAMERPMMIMEARLSAAPTALKTTIEPGQLSTSITLNFRYMLER
jgi:uncharacterized protein